MKIKHRIVLFSFTATLLSMLLTFLVFYFFIFAEIKKDRVEVFKSHSISLIQKFNDFVDYYYTAVKKYALYKDFVFVTNENFAIKNLSLKSAKKIQHKIISEEDGLKEIYIFDKNYKEVFGKELDIDLMELLNKKLIIKHDFLYVHSKVGNSDGYMVFKVSLFDLKIKLKENYDFDYYLFSKEGKLLFYSLGFKLDSNTRYKEKESFFYKDGKFYYILPHINYSIGTVVEEDTLFKRTDTILWIMIFAIGFIILISMIHAIQMSSYITKSIYKLIKVLETNTDGNYQKIDLKGDEEIEYFAQKYNNMIERISKFTEELEEKVKRRTSKIEKQKEKLKYLSEIDPLTGIYNRMKLNNIVKEIYENHEHYSMILFDIDDFKKINDRYGHKVGDEVLKDIAKIMRNSVRSSDFIGRWGGEEFIIICVGANLQQAYEIAEKVRKKIENHNFINNLKITASFGVSESKDNLKYDDIFVRSDRALYEAKKTGKNKSVYISGE